MSLEEWVEYGWLKTEPTSRDEIKNLLTIVDRDLKDANVTAVSQDRRFEAAYNAARTAAMIALRACGYRTSSQTGHHLKTIESLKFTIRADDKLIQRNEAALEETECDQLRRSGERLKSGIGLGDKDSN